MTEGEIVHYSQGLGYHAFFGSHLIAWGHSLGSERVYSDANRNARKYLAICTCWQKCNYTNTYVGVLSNLYFYIQNIENLNVSS